MDYTDIIEHEKRKRALLLARIAETDKRIALFEAMRAEDRSWDAILESSAAKAAGATTKPTPPPPAAQQGGEQLDAGQTFRDDPKKMSRQWRELIYFLGADGKSFDEVKAYLAAKGNQITAGAARTGLMNWRKEYGFVANPVPGRYTATERALDFIRAQMDSEEETF